MNVKHKVLIIGSSLRREKNMLTVSWILADSWCMGVCPVFSVVVPHGAPDSSTHWNRGFLFTGVHAC